MEQDQQADDAAVDKHLADLVGGSVDKSARARSVAATALQLACVAVLGVSLARIIASVTLGPVIDAPEVGSSATGQTQTGLDIDTAILSSFDPFHRQVSNDVPEQIATVEAAPETSLNLKLFGVHVRGTESNASAIIENPRGDQSSYSIGDEIIAGVTLAAVYTDYIEIIRGGVRESLFFPGSNAKKVRARQAARQGRQNQALVQTPAPTAVSRPANPNQYVRNDRPTSVSLTQKQFEKLLRTTSLRPRSGADAGGGYIIAPRGSAALLNQLGFKTGDILLRVNGERLTNPERLEELMRDSKSQTEIAFTIERQSKTLTLSFAYVG